MVTNGFKHYSIIDLYEFFTCIPTEVRCVSCTVHTKEVYGIGNYNNITDIFLSLLYITMHLWCKKNEKTFF